jgi:hypothetical protein
MAIAPAKHPPQKTKIKVATSRSPFFSPFYGPDNGPGWDFFNAVFWLVQNIPRVEMAFFSFHGDPSST